MDYLSKDVWVQGCGNLWRKICRGSAIDCPTGATLQAALLLSAKPNPPLPAEAAQLRKIEPPMNGIHKKE